MNAQAQRTQVGAPDPNAKTSLIAEEMDEEYDVARLAVPGEPVCYFNNHQFGHGQEICSGSTRLQCRHGVWLRTGSCYTSS